MLFPAKNLKNSIEMFLNGARLNFSIFGHIEPVVACIIDGDIKIFGMSFKNSDDKDTFAEMIQSLIASGTIKEYIMVVEAWVAASKDRDYKKINEWLERYGSLSDFPERYESVMVQYCSAEETVHYFAKINRSGSEAILESWEKNVFKFEGPLELSGRFQGLFPKSKAGLN